MSSDSKPTLVELSEKNFDEVIAGNKPVLVDFWATWCGPCQFMLPIFDKLAKKYEEKVVFGRLNVDDNQGVAMRFDVYAIPTFIVFMNRSEEHTSELQSQSNLVCRLLLEKK